MNHNLNVICQFMLWPVGFALQLNKLDFWARIDIEFSKSETFFLSPLETQLNKICYKFVRARVYFRIFGAKKELSRSTYISCPRGTLSQFCRRKMVFKVDPERVKLLKEFVELFQQHPGMLQLPELEFFKQWIERQEISLIKLLASELTHQCINKIIT